MQNEFNPEKYVTERLNQYQGWYDAKAVRMKRNYLRGRVWSAVSAVLVPIITNISIPEIHLPNNITIDLMKILATLLSTLVALLIALEGVLHYREQWKNYRTTEQYLTLQRHLFQNKVGEYAKLTPDEAFKLLVKNVEKAIADENAITLNVLTKTDSNTAS